MLKIIVFETVKWLLISVVIVVTLAFLLERIIGISLMHNRQVMSILWTVTVLIIVHLRKKRNDRIIEQYEETGNE